MSTLEDRQADARIRAGALTKPTKKDEDYRFSDPDFFDLDRPLIANTHDAVELGHLAQAVLTSVADKAVVGQIVDASVHTPATTPAGVTVSALADAPESARICRSRPCLNSSATPGSNATAWTLPPTPRA